MESLASVLAKQYYELSSSTLHLLYKEIMSENASAESIYGEGMKKKLVVIREDKALYGLIMNQWRPQVMIFLNTLFFNMEELMKSKYLSFWWEFSYRVEKMLTVALILERENLLRLGGKPEASDIPQCIPVVYDYIMHLRNTNAFDELRTQHMSCIQAHPLFHSLYLQ